MVTQRSDVLSRTFSDAFVGIDLLISHKLVQPALVLLYSTIDAAASIERLDQDADVTREEFIGWVNRYLLADARYQVTALDLYGARCGILHSFTAGSRLSRQRKAREVGYAWGAATVSDLQAMITINGSPNVVPIKVEELAIGFREGVEAFFAEVRADPARKARVLSNAERLFGHNLVLPGRA